MTMVLMKVSALPGKTKEFVQTVRLLANSTRASTGCLSHDWYQSAEDARSFVLIETWENLRVLRRHQGSYPFKVLAGAVRTLAERFDIQFFTVPNTSAGGGFGRNLTDLYCNSDGRLIKD